MDILLSDFAIVAIIAFGIMSIVLPIFWLVYLLVMMRQETISAHKTIMRGSDMRLLNAAYLSELKALMDYKEKRKEHSKFVEEVIYGDD